MGWQLLGWREKKRCTKALMATAYTPPHDTLTYTYSRWMGLKWLRFPTSPLLVGYETRDSYEMFTKCILRPCGHSYFPRRFWSLYKHFHSLAKWRFSWCSWNGHIARSSLPIMCILSVEWLPYYEHAVQSLPRYVSFLYLFWEPWQTTYHSKPHTTIHICRCSIEVCSWIWHIYLNPPSNPYTWKTFTCTYMWTLGRWFWELVDIWKSNRNN